jgi:hypothetical protein
MWVVGINKNIWKVNSTKTIFKRPHNSAITSNNLKIQA